MFQIATHKHTKILSDPLKQKPIHINHIYTKEALVTEVPVSQE
jgi:hypothetical protein